MPQDKWYGQTNPTGPLTHLFYQNKHMYGGVSTMPLLPLSQKQMMSLMLNY